MLTFVRGVALYRWLRAEGRSVALNVCLSDTSRLLSADKRGALRAAIRERRYADCIPVEYVQALSSGEIDDLNVILQTRNSNRFVSLIKKAKLRYKAADSQESFYHERGAVLLRSHDGERFAVSGPFLMPTFARGADVSGGDGSELDPQPREREVLRSLRDNAQITLYQKGLGPLCPSTYGGLLLHYGELYDHICLYSRSDDEHIAEKILRGVIATNWLKPEFARTCLQVVFPEVSSRPELYALSSEQMLRHRPPWSAMLASLRDRGVFEAMSLYNG